MHESIQTISTEGIGDCEDNRQAQKMTAHTCISTSEHSGGEYPDDSDSSSNPGDLDDGPTDEEIELANRDLPTRDYSALDKFANPQCVSVRV